LSRDKDNVLRHSTSFDKATAKKVFESATENNFVRYLPREDISQEICSGDTSPIAITAKGNQYCQTIITDYLDELPSSTIYIIMDHGYCH
jgi:hypothetical protein